MVNIRQLDQDSDLYPGDEPDPVCALSFNQMSHGDTRWLNTPVPYGSKGLCSLHIFILVIFIIRASNKTRVKSTVMSKTGM